MAYRWPEEDLNMPKRRRRWPGLLLALVLMGIVFATIFYWPL
jgi:hypothetical protein